jgi:hypothetical protein
MKGHGDANHYHCSDFDRSNIPVGSFGLVRRATTNAWMVTVLLTFLVALALVGCEISWWTIVASALTFSVYDTVFDAIAFCCFRVLVGFSGWLFPLVIVEVLMIGARLKIQQDKAARKVWLKPSDVTAGVVVLDGAGGACPEQIANDIADYLRVAPFDAGNPPRFHADDGIGHTHTRPAGWLSLTDPWVAFGQGSPLGDPVHDRWTNYVLSKAQTIILVDCLPNELKNQRFVQVVSMWVGLQSVPPRARPLSIFQLMDPESKTCLYPRSSMMNTTKARVVATASPHARIVTVVYPGSVEFR